MINHPQSVRRFALRWAMALAALLLPLAGLSGPAAAQGVTTGDIRGQVADEAGAPLPGATVTAENVQTGFRRQALSDDDGFYTLRLLPPGEYRVRAEMLGRQVRVVGPLRVTAGGGTTANFQLTTAAIELEALVVSGDRPVVDATEGGVRTLVSEDQVETLPALGRDFTDFVNLSGLVSPIPEETTGGQFSIAGMRPSQTNVQIDGVDANNAFFGENRGGARIPFVFSLESIKEFQIITNGYDVEYGNYSGGVVNVVTRGGTNEWDGTVYANYRSDALIRDDFDGNPIEDFEVAQFAGRVSGPIIRDRLHFLLSADGQRRREPQLPITPEQFGPGGEDEDPATFSAFQQYLDVLENQYGVANAASGYKPFTTSEDAITLFGRLDWTVNDDHRLTVRHNYAHFENGDEFDPFFDFRYGVSRAEQFEDNSHSFVTELQSVLGSQTFNVFRVQLSTEERPRNGNDLRPEIRVDLGTGEEVRYGGSFAAFRNNLEESKVQVIDNLTHSIGDHTIKVGGNGIVTNIKNRFLLLGAGLYRFRSLEDFANFQPSSFERNVRANGEVPFAEFNVAEWSLYAQDEWHVTPKLTATLGLRYDQQRFLDDPGRVIDAERAFGIQTGFAAEDTDNVSPRLALAYDLFGDGSAVVRGGAGYFYGRVPYVLGGNVQQTEIPVLTVTCRGDPGAPNAPPSIENYANWSPGGLDNPSACAGQTGVGGVPTYTFWTEGFEYPETFKANVGYEQLIGARTRASIDLVFSRSTNLYTVRNLNLRDPVFTLAGEDGRRIFQPESVFDPSVGGGTAHLRNLEFADVFANYDDGQAESFAGTAEIRHQLGGRSQVSLSYTYARAFDNSSYSCCTASGGFGDVSVGAFGPNEIGERGDESRAWGASDFVRNHTIVLSGNVDLPYGFRVSGLWRMQSGRPWTPIVEGDLNGDGLDDNDRPFIFAPENLPLAATDPAEVAEQRARYEGFLNDSECVREAVGGIIERNACRLPWFNRLDMTIAKSFRTTRGQRMELQADLFNVLNGLNEDWGRFVGVFGGEREILEPVSYDDATDQILYRVSNSFGETARVGTNLNLQFQAQLGVKYFF